MSKIEQERDAAIMARDDHMRNAKRLASLLVRAQDELRQCSNLLGESEKFVAIQAERIQQLEGGLTLLLSRVIYADDRIAWESVGLTHSFSDELESVIIQCRNALGIEQ